MTQILAVLLLILQPFYQGFIPVPLGIWAMYLAVIITVVSGVEYFYRFHTA